MENIIVQPGAVWAYYETECRDNLDHVIAGNPDYGIEIMLGDDDMPVFTVYCDGYEIDSEFAVNERDCINTARRIYETYLKPAAIDEVLKYDEPDTEDFNEEEFCITEREEELDIAIHEMLCAVAPNFDYSDNDTEEIKDAVLELLARRFEIPIWRPMFLEDDDGTTFYEEYPYDVMLFDEDE